MSEGEKTNEFPAKLCLADVTPVTLTTEARDGTQATNLVQWVISDETVGAESHVLGTASYAPGAIDGSHRHPNAEQTNYLLQGSGRVWLGDTEIHMNAGDVLFIPRNAWHSFENTSPGTTIMIWTYGGAANQEQAGCVLWDDDATTTGDAPSASE